MADFGVRMVQISTIMLTNKGDPNGNFNNLRPFSINNETGRVSMSEGLDITGGKELHMGNARLTGDGNIWGTR